MGCCYSARVKNSSLLPVSACRSKENDLLEHPIDSEGNVVVLSNSGHHVVRTIRQQSNESGFEDCTAENQSLLSKKEKELNGSAMKEHGSVIVPRPATGACTPLLTESEIETLAFECPQSERKSFIQKLLKAASRKKIMLSATDKDNKYRSEKGSNKIYKGASEQASPLRTLVKPPTEAVVDKEETLVTDIVATDADNTNFELVDIQNVDTSAGADSSKSKADDKKTTEVHRSESLKKKLAKQSAKLIKVQPRGRGDLSKKAAGKSKSGVAPPPAETYRSSADKDGNYFLELVGREERRLKSMCDQWEAEIGSPAVGEEGSGKVRSAVGKTSLLLNKKFRQFRDLCDKNLDPKAHPRPNGDDLQGFWDMVLIQIQDVDLLFANLEAMKSTNWESKSPVPPRKVNQMVNFNDRPVTLSSPVRSQGGRASISGPSGADNPAVSKFAQHREEARRKLQEARKMTQSKPQEPQIQFYIPPKPAGNKR